MFQKLVSQVKITGVNKNTIYYGAWNVIYPVQCWLPAHPPQQTRKATLVNDHVGKVDQDIDSTESGNSWKQIYSQAPRNSSLWECLIAVIQKLPDIPDRDSSHPNELLKRIMAENPILNQNPHLTKHILAILSSEIQSLRNRSEFPQLNFSALDLSTEFPIQSIHVQSDASLEVFKIAP
jgi:hypothetical protein